MEKIQLFLGRAGELRVASELLLRGVDVSMMLVDIGTDLILSNGIRIQVKTAHKLPPRRGSSVYQFRIKIVERDPVTKRIRRIRKLSKDVDFLILWAIEDNVFLIIPTKEINVLTTISYSPKAKNNQFAKYINKWNLLI